MCRDSYDVGEGTVTWRRPPCWRRADATLLWPRAGATASPEDLNPLPPPLPPEIKVDKGHEHPWGSQLFDSLARAVLLPFASPWTMGSKVTPNPSKELLKCSDREEGPVPLS